MKSYRQCASLVWYLGITWEDLIFAALEHKWMREISINRLCFKRIYAKRVLLSVELKTEPDYLMTIMAFES